MAPPETSAGTITVVQATHHDQPVIAHLVQLMLYDLSPLYGEWIGRDGRYAYGCLDWAEEGHHPYLLCRKGQLAGFALVSAHSPLSKRTPCWFMDELFVLGAQRQRGYGRSAIRESISRHPGDWEIAAVEMNQAAISFWAKALAQLQLANLKAETQTHDGHVWVVHRFIS